jgi:hypothetical protein
VEIDRLASMALDAFCRLRGSGDGFFHRRPDDSFAGDGWELCVEIERIYRLNDTPDSAKAVGRLAERLVRLARVDDAITRESSRLLAWREDEARARGLRDAIGGFFRDRHCGAKPSAEDLGEFAEMLAAAATRVCGYPASASRLLRELRPEMVSAWKERKSRLATEAVIDKARRARFGERAARGRPAKRR